MNTRANSIVDIRVIRAIQNQHFILTFETILQLYETCYVYLLYIKILPQSVNDRQTKMARIWQQPVCNMHKHIVNLIQMFFLYNP